MRRRLFRLDDEAQPAAGLFRVDLDLEGAVGAGGDAQAVFAQGRGAGLVVTQVAQGFLARAGAAQ